MTIHLLFIFLFSLSFSIAMNTPPRSPKNMNKENSSSACWFTPTRSAEKNKTAPKTTPRRKAYRKLLSEYENIQTNQDYGNCRTVLRKNMAFENKRQDISYTEKSTLYRLLISQGRPWCIICQYQPIRSNNDSAQNNVVAITPMSFSDYDNLIQIRDEYVESATKTGSVFLERQYGTRAEFSAKLELLNRVWEELEDTSKPVLYTQPINMFTDSWNEPDPHFNSSVPFTIFYGHKLGSSTYVKAVGDVWLSHYDDSDLLCLYGTTERSTMIDLNFQGLNIGPTAVRGLYSQLIHPWTNKKVMLIDYENQTYQSGKEIFDGVISYVDPKNYKSIGQNIRSGNIIFGISDDGMLMFRAINPYSCTMNGILQSLYNQGSILDYEKMSNLLNKLYPNESVIGSPSQNLSEYRSQQELYIHSQEYNSALEEFIHQFSRIFLIDDASPLKKKIEDVTMYEFPHFPGIPDGEIMYGSVLSPSKESLFS